MMPIAVRKITVAASANSIIVAHSAGNHAASAAVEEAGYRFSLNHANRTRKWLPSCRTCYWLGETGGGHKALCLQSNGYYPGFRRRWEPPAWAKGPTARDR